MKNSFPLPDELRPILFLSLYIYDQSCSFSLQNYDQTCSFSLQNYEQGVQHFQKFNFRCLFLLNKASYQRSEMIEIPIFSPSFLPLNIVLEWSSPLNNVLYGRNKYVLPICLPIHIHFPTHLYFPCISIYNTFWGFGRAGYGDLQFKRPRPYNVLWYSPAPVFT